MTFHSDNISEENKTNSDSTETVRGLAGVAGVAGVASQVVFQAAAIMEEEIAAGIVAAKQVEKHFVNTSVPPSDRSNVLMQRFRKDLHEVVDMVLDVVDVATNYVGMPNQSDIRIRSVKQKEQSDHLANGQLPTLLMPEPANAGERVELTISLENNSTESTGEFGFASTDLISTSGNRISARQVKFAPPLVSIAAKETEEVTISVNIPRGKQIGTYSGLIQATRNYQLQAVMVVRVS